MLDASVTSVNISFLKRVAGGLMMETGMLGRHQSFNLVRLDGHVIGFIARRVLTGLGDFKCVNNSDVSNRPKEVSCVSPRFPPLREKI